MLAMVANLLPKLQNEHLLESVGLQPHGRRHHIHHLDRRLHIHRHGQRHRIQLLDLLLLKFIAQLRNQRKQLRRRTLLELSPFVYHEEPDQLPLVAIPQTRDQGHRQRRLVCLTGAVSCLLPHRQKQGKMVLPRLHRLRLLDPRRQVVRLQHRPENQPQHQQKLRHLLLVMVA